VFLNLLVNACQAMPNGGEMRIRVDVADPEHVRVTFRDTGVVECRPRMSSVSCSRL
jgi:signal transduction histidine kinase